MEVSVCIAVQIQKIDRTYKLVSLRKKFIRDSFEGLSPTFPAFGFP